jgi:sulfur relay (sulfurtransferase) complex TusBCD TusD component (DsrE family)
MEYSIIINPNNKSSHASTHAFDFSNAILKNEEHCVHVFFYGYAVKHAFYNSDDWYKIANKNISLNACSTIAEAYLLKKLEVLPHFKLVGLGQWMHHVLKSTKRIEFT